MIHKTRGIVLHTTRYGESSLVVNCYTEQFGRQALMAKGVRKSRKQNRSSYFQPLSILDFEVYHKAGRDIHLIREVGRPVPLHSIPSDITKRTQAIFMAEVLYRVVREEEQNPVLSQFLMHTVRYLDAMEEPSPDFHIVFLFQLSRFLGFYPQKYLATGDRFFDLASGRFQSYRTDPELQLDEAASLVWSAYIQSDYGNVRPQGLTSRQRKFILESLMRYYKMHVDGMGEVKSLEVLHDFFHN